MNDIEFRALGKDGIWRYGKYPWHGADMPNTVIGLQAFWTILPVLRRETLGQWIGLKDKQGKKIYEGDIILLQYGKGVKKIAVVEWANDSAQFILQNKQFSASMSKHIQDRGDEIIGNIYEHPGLIKQEA